MKDRHQRLKTIKKLIKNNKIKSQDELLNLLLADGFEVTQATLSRDLKLMKVGKTILFRVNGMGKTSFPATISSVDQAVDKTDYSIKVYARVKDSNPTFRPGMYVRAKLVAE